MAKGESGKVRDRSFIITLLIVILGMALVIFGAKAPPLVEWGIDWNTFSTNLGLYIAVVVSLQWTFDFVTRRNLLEEVTAATVANVNVARSGLADFVENTKSISYQSMLANESPLYIGFQYSPRLIDDHIVELRNRAKKGHCTTILLANPTGKSVGYLREVHGEMDHIDANIKKIMKKISDLNQDQNCQSAIKVKFHDSILRYSFALNGQGVWVKMYRNSRGDSIVPGVYVRTGSLMYDYFNSDVIGLDKEAVDVGA